MDRLTYRNMPLHAVPTKFDLDFAFKMDDTAWGGLTEAFDHLAAYEDTGLTPEEITALIAESTVSKMETTTLKEELRDAYENHCDDFIRLNSEIVTLKKALELACDAFDYTPSGHTLMDLYIQQAQEQEGNHE